MKSSGKKHCGDHFGGSNKQQFFEKKTKNCAEIFSKDSPKLSYCLIEHSNSSKE